MKKSELELWIVFLVLSSLIIVICLGDLENLPILRQYSIYQVGTIENISKINHFTYATRDLLSYEKDGETIRVRTNAILPCSEKLIEVRKTYSGAELPNNTGRNGDLVIYKLKWSVSNDGCYYIK